MPGNLTEHERSWLKNHPTIRLAPDPQFQPIEFFDKDGDYAGIGADYVRLIEKKLGIRFEIVRCKNWDDVVERIKRRKVDVLNAVVKTPQRQTFLHFPPPYLKIPSVIIVRNIVTGDLTLDLLKGMQVVMVSGYGYVDLIRNQYPQIEIELVPDLKAALRKVSFGMADAFVGDMATASFYIELEGITNLKSAGETDPPNISGFAVRSDWPELTHILEKGVALITEEERTTIYKKWIHLSSEPGLTIGEFQKVMLVIAGAFSIVIVGFLLWTRLLKRVVSSQTEDLRREIEERKQAEKSLAENEAQLRTLLKTIPDLVWLKDPQGIYLACNSRFERFFGAKEEDIIGKTDYDFVEKDLADFFRQHDKIAMAKGKPSINEEVVTFADDGHREHLETIKTPIYGGDEQLIGVLGIARDITDRKQAEEAMQASESMQRKMVANIGDVIAIIDRNGINRYKSPNIEKLFGWKPEDVVGASTWDNVHPEDLESTQKFMGSLMHEPNAVGTTECRYKCKDGSYRWIEFTGSNLLHDPDIKGILGNYHDITRRKQDEQSLLESEVRFKALHNASFGGIAIHDKGIILECNKGLSEMTGYSEEELIGMDGLRLIAEKSKDAVMRNIVAGYEKPYEAIGVRKNGEEFPIRLEARNIPYKGKNVRTVEFRDLSESTRAEEERKKLQDQLTQAQKMESVGRLAGGVAHDFNNMLSVILGYSELAMERLEPSTPIQKNLQEIYKAAKRSTDITRQLLAFARQQTIAPKVLDLNDTIENMLKMLRRLIGEDIDLAWLPGTKVRPVKMDPSQIDQILANLCVNARDAISDVGSVTIKTENISFDADYCADHPGFVPGEYVLLAVSDDGSGMAPETLDKLFEPFFTTKDVSQGTGLGLATVYGIVKQNNGFINVDSELEKGTTFKIYLPGHTGKTEKTSKNDSIIPDPRGNETILLIEDEISILRMTTAMLKRLGYTVLAANTPGKAIALAHEQEGKVDLLMTDVIMPEMNGRDLAKNLLSLYPGLKCLFMSGYTADVIAHHGVLDEGVEFIQKPFTKTDLAVKIRKVLGEMKQASQEYKPQDLHIS